MAFELSADIGKVWHLGGDLRRPESVLALKDGRIFCSDRSRGVVRVAPGARHQPALDMGEDFVPNGIALLADGSFLIANVGPAGGVWRMVEPGRLVPFGRGLPAIPAGFVYPLAHGQFLVTFTTTSQPRDLAFRKGVANGAMGIIGPDGGFRKIASGLAFPNEARVDPSGRWLYVTETFAQRISRFEFSAGGDLGPPELFCELGSGHWPDGFEFDVEGNLWVTCVVSNRLLLVRPDGSITTLFSDVDPDELDKAQAHFVDGTFGWEDMARGKGARLYNASSIAFGGIDRKTVLVGSLGGDTLLSFHAGTAGVVPPHWDVQSTVLD